MPRILKLNLLQQLPRNPVRIKQATHRPRLRINPMIIITILIIMSLKNHVRILMNLIKTLLIQTILIQIIISNPLTLQNQRPTRLQPSLRLSIPPLTNIILRLNSLHILTIHQVIPHHNIKTPTKKTRILTPSRNRSLLIIQSSTIQLPHNKFITTPLITTTLRPKHTIIILQHSNSIKTTTSSQIISIHTQRSIPLQRLLNPTRIHTRLPLSPRTQLNTHTTIPSHQPTRNIMSKQSTLTSTRRLIHHHKLTIRRLQPSQNLIRSPLLPRSRLTTKIPQPKQTKIRQRLTSLLHQRRSNKLTTNLPHPQQLSSLQTHTTLITTLKPITSTHTKTRPPTRLLNPPTLITRTKILLPFLQLRLQHPHTVTPRPLPPERTCHHTQQNSSSIKSIPG